METCVDCGRKTEKLYDGSCAECYLRRHKLISLPEYLDITICAHCDSYKHKERWIDGTVDDAINAAIQDNISVSEDVRYSFSFEKNELDKNLFELAITVKGLVFDISFEEKYSANLRVSINVCDRCSRYRGGYFESIVQFRARRRHPSKEEIEEAISTVREALKPLQESDRNAFIADMEEVKGGVDFYLGTQGAGSVAARALLSSFGGAHQTSAKMAGYKGGIRQYRTTHLVRIPEYRTGDALRHENRMYLVRSVSGSSAALVDMENLDALSLSHKDLEEAEILSRKEDIKEAVVVLAGQDSVQIIDPESNKALEVQIPKGFKPGETVKIVRIDDRIWVLPE